MWSLAILVTFAGITFYEAAWKLCGYCFRTHAIAGFQREKNTYKAKKYYA
jgi:hypothetical protein|tara:strand:+ start:591 stop:740 length:150 start_codon:yes stop_codon:yes gene_type:complete